MRRVWEKVCKSALLIIIQFFFATAKKDELEDIPEITEEIVKSLDAQVRYVALRPAELKTAQHRHQISDN